MSAAKQTIEEKMNKLEEILQWFESEKVTVESALTYYEQAEEIAKELEDELLKAKNKIEVIKQKYS